MKRWARSVYEINLTLNWISRLVKVHLKGGSAAHSETIIHILIKSRTFAPLAFFIAALNYIAMYEVRVTNMLSFRFPLHHQMLQRMEIPHSEFSEIYFKSTAAW